ncbi:hypothetical protein [Candidatus Deianiraea vastatrix]|uniref:Uncharacterized protein n=1 Tax=Candidatus Deianiraea vastatrix TaxID=2163644 RepID=A0A5B8XFR6_9RICK|nr:hypothetical protein [Candidatus Deianiraea vastatrix]QED23779.1 hypothetical protein Deia_00995 [Candidatus Deianiraea vastatrix]
MGAKNKNNFIITSTILLTTLISSVFGNLFFFISIVFSLYQLNGYMLTSDGRDYAKKSFSLIMQSSAFRKDLTHCIVENKTIKYEAISACMQKNGHDTGKIDLNKVIDDK